MPRLSPQTLTHGDQKRFAQHFGQSVGTKRESGQQVRDWPQRRITLEVTGQLLQEGLPQPIAGFLVEFSLRASLLKVNLVATSSEVSLPMVSGWSTLASPERHAVGAPEQ